MVDKAEKSKTERVHLTTGYVRKLVPSVGHTVYIFDTDPKQLCVRVTPAGAKSFAYRGKLHGVSLRITIGSTETWALADARAEARRLQTQIDNGDDPRQVKADKREAKETAAAAKAVKEIGESVTVGTVWAEYLAARKPQWSERHYRDHVEDMHPGGAVRSRSAALTVPGTLASLAALRLIDLTPERVEQWAAEEALKRPTRARLSLRLLKAFLFWCARHPTYKGFVGFNAASSKTAKESLGKAKVKNDVLQREQLPAWFAAVRQIGNPVISAYLQSLLLTGSRRNELAALRWEEVDFQWNSLTIHDKVEGLRVIPLTPYVSSLLSALPRRSEWVFSSPMAASGRLTDPSTAHGKACAVAGLNMTLHGLRRSFATLCEWTETPSGIAAQIQGHAPQGVREQNYIRRPLDLLRMWHVKIEAWILEQAGIAVPEKAGLQLVQNHA